LGKLGNDWAIIGQMGQRLGNSGANGAIPYTPPRLILSVTPRL